MKNKVQLCTYADRLGGGDLSTLGNLLNQQLRGLFDGVHILPFYYPIDGADAGFDPIDHTQVDQRLGGWKDIARLAEKYEIMVDVIVNHMSVKSPEFKDYQQSGEQSRYRDLFLTYEKVFPNGATEQQLTDLYRPRPGLPFTKIKLADGTARLFWTTFTADQVDIDVLSESGKAYLTRILDQLQQAKVKTIRLDAAGYAVKQAGSRCFMTDMTFDYIESFARQAGDRGIEVLVEIHTHYLTQVEIAKRVSWVYDFALPPLVLHALIAKDSLPLQNWYKISPRNAITVLDTHDGIGIIDIAADKAVGPGLLNDEQVHNLVEQIHTNSQHHSRKATGAAASNVDLYQINCTFHEALGSDDNAYLLARLIQFFSPGIPQVYYVGLFAGENDMSLLEETGVGRDINRHVYGSGEIDIALQKPVVRHLLGLIRFRNAHPAFQHGEFICETTEAQQLTLAWEAAEHSVVLNMDLSTNTFTVRERDGSRETLLTEWAEFQHWVDHHA